MSKKIELKNEIEQQIFEKMKAKDFGESMCNETKLNVLKWTMQQLRKHDVSGSLLSDEESQYRLDLINELINIYEHPEDSNKGWKDAIISVAREKGYGNDR